MNRVNCSPSEGGEEDLEAGRSGDDGEIHPFNITRSEHVSDRGLKKRRVKSTAVLL